jgi:hypothetical protein
VVFPRLVPQHQQVLVAGMAEVAVLLSVVQVAVAVAHPMFVLAALQLATELLLLVVAVALHFMGAVSLVRLLPQVVTEERFSRRTAAGSSVQDLSLLVVVVLVQMEQPVALRRLLLRMD